MDEITPEMTPDIDPEGVEAAFRRELAEQCAALLTVSGRGEWTAAGSRPRRTDRRLLRPAPPRRPPPPEIPGDPDLIIE